MLPVPIYGKEVKEMRVDSKSNIEGIYETNMKKNTVAGNSKQENKLNQDRVEISETASSYDEQNSIKDKIVKEVESPTNPNKLRELKAKIENGTYHVSSTDIAGAIVRLSGGGGANRSNE